jgi:hypothetical protein
MVSLLKITTVSLLTNGQGEEKSDRRYFAEGPISAKVPLGKCAADW